MSDILITITGNQLAERLQTNPASIRAYRAGVRRQPLLIGLPEPIQSQPRLVWLVADIEAWIESRRTFRPDAVPVPPEPSRRRGRPSKAEQARRAAQQGSAA